MYNYIKTCYLYLITYLIMNIFLLQPLQNNQLIINNLLLETVLSSLQEKKNSDEPIIINKTLYKYLHKTKELIDNRIDQWDRYKKCTNPYEYIHTIIPNTKQSISTFKPISRSFFKMIEICKTLEILKNINAECNSFHLAEGPGGFIEALSYMRNNPNDKYIGMTLIDDSNHNVPGWKKSKHFLDNNSNVFIETGIEKNGDITRSSNLKYCYNKYKNHHDIITGDGGFDFSYHYPLQEQICNTLILSQVSFAICMQKKGGTFILKMYDIFTRFSIDILFLLSNVYENIHIIKPNTSRFANSEKYIVSKNFQCNNVDNYFNLFYKILQKIELNNNTVINNSIFNFDIPYIYTNKIEEINSILGQQQIDTIVSTIYLIDNINNYEKIEHLKKKNIQKCINWCQKYDIPYTSTIFNNNLFLSNQNRIGKYSTRSKNI